MEGFRPISTWNEDDRPREKLILKGRHALSDAELLAILLGTGARYQDEVGNIITKSALDLGKDILQKAGNDLLQLARMGDQELKQIKGIGQAKAISVIAALELGSRRKAARDDRRKVNGSRDAFEAVSPYMEDLTVEHFYAILLSQANKILKVARLSEGGITSTVMDPGPLFKAAVLENARNIILCHNHPSGNLKPSDADIQITRKLKAAGALLDMHVQDHIIVTNQGYFSFGDNGLM